MNNILLAVIVLLILTVALIGVQILLKRNILKNAMTALGKGEFETYFIIIDKTLTKMLIPAFNREYMRLNGYMMKQDQEKIDETVDVLITMRMNKNQQREVLLKTFNYYVGIGNATYSKKILEHLKALNDENMSKQCQRNYDIFIEEKTSYIDEMLKEVNVTENPTTKGYLYYMLGMQYFYLKDYEQAREQFKQAQVQVQETMLEPAVQAMLEEVAKAKKKVKNTKG